MRSSTSLPVFAALGLIVVGCSAGDIARNTARNAFGPGSERGADLVGAFVQSEADLYAQAGIKFSPEQEYFLGRGVAASAIAKYGLDKDEAKQAYVRRIGAALVELSPRVRSTYGGYHFAILDSDEANGFSGPGGFVMVTRGAVARAKNEEELAGVLAHEIAHVSLKHGERVIRESEQWRTNYTSWGRIALAASGAGARQTSKLTNIFRDTVRGLAAAQATQGYGPPAEHAADVEGSKILYDAGYDAGAIAAYLKTTADRPQTAWSAHPDSASRITALEQFLATYGGPFDGGVGTAARSARFSGVVAKH